MHAIYEVSQVQIQEFSSGGVQPTEKKFNKQKTKKKKPDKNNDKRGEGGRFSIILG